MTNFNTTISWICESAYLSLPPHIKETSILNPTKTYISITGLDLYYDQTNLGSFLHWHFCHPPIFLSTTTRFGSSHNTDIIDTDLIKLTYLHTHHTCRFGVIEEKTDPWSKGDPWKPKDTKNFPTKTEPDLTPPPTSSASSYNANSWNNVNKEHYPPWTYSTGSDKNEK